MERSREPPTARRTQVICALAVFVMIAADVGVGLPLALARVPTRAATILTDTRLRTEPDGHAASVLRLHAGTRVTVRGQAADGWYRVRRGHLEGYVPSGDVATAAVPARTRGQTGETIDAPATVSEEQRAKTPDSAAKREGKRARDHAPDHKRNREKDSRDVEVAGELNLRAGPSGDDAVVAVIPRRARVQPTGEHRDGYVEVVWDGKSGWVLGKKLIASSPVVTTVRKGESWSRGELKAIIFAAADRYGQPREDMLRVARCESDLVPSAINASGGSYGLFQFKPGTWLGTPYGDYDIFDPRASANAAGWMWSQGRRREWVCQ